MNRLSRYLDGLIEAVWLFSLILVALYFSSTLAQTFTLGKTVFLRSLVWVGAAAWIAKEMALGNWRWDGASFSKLWETIKRQSLFLLAVGLGLVFILSTLTSINPLISLHGNYGRFDGLTTLLTYLLLFAMIASNLRRRDQVDRLIITLAAASFTVDLYAILQRAGLDPFAWVNPVEARAVSTIGQPIFLAAYLGMTLLLFLGRSVYLIQVYKTAASRPVAITHIALYLLVSALNLVGIWVSVARGPLIALMAGLAILGVALLIYLRLRRTLFFAMGLGALVFAFIAILNVPGGPLSGLRDHPAVGPLGHIFDQETGTGRTRVLIWNGMVRLVTPHASIQRADTGMGDMWNFLRPLIGYGPETINLVFEDYYLPESFSAESYELYHDHAHNEFWDSLAFYGLAGFLLEYGFFLNLMYSALHWLGWIASPQETKRFWILSGLGALIGGLGTYATLGVEFIGLGIPLGLLLGPVTVLLQQAFRPAMANATPFDPWRDILLISILALIVFHYVEILFGISVQPSRALFWAMIGAMLAIRRGLESEAAHAKNEARWLGVAGGLVLSVTLALSAGFIQKNAFGLSLFTILFNSLIPGSIPTVLGIFIGVILFTSLLVETDRAARTGTKLYMPAFVKLLGMAVAGTLAIWLLLGGAHALTMSTSNISPAQLAGKIEALISLQFFSGLLCAYGWGWFLSQPSQPTHPKSPSPKAEPSALFWVAQALALAFAIFANLRPMQADAVASLANQYSTAGQFEYAVEFTERVLALAPTRDAYFVGAGNIEIQYANMLTGQARLARYIKAETYFKRAFELNPMFYPNIMGMAHINRVWASAADDPNEAQQRFAQADQYYAILLEDRPYRVLLWTEWAEFHAELGNLTRAREIIDAALQIDDTFAEAYSFSADLHLYEAERQTDPAARVDQLNRALNDYLSQIEMLNRRGVNPARAYFGVGEAYLRLGKYSEAREAFLQAWKLGLGDNQWRVYKKLADLAGLTNNPADQYDFLVQAIAYAPASEAPALQSELDALQP